MDNWKNEQLEYYIEKHNTYHITDRSLYYTSSCNNLHWTVWEIYIRNARTSINNLMCSIDAHDKQNPSSGDDGSSGGSNVLPQN